MTGDTGDLGRPLTRLCRWPSTNLKGSVDVVSDNTRGHAAELALEVTRRLGIPARPSTPAYSREWGIA